ncbi:uncharacterized protein E0L32_011362 [Thyridium curvatum]|uniref:Zn(2)-C6 fungal-type domain-containing protein n=1 Tax=Thyridium curvatum TaxID=1093900 RepID=A0A507BN59_9PEZI|nr:uncharacterized protein E0L32_011362 [Thyridium curvatum]TPX18969.1 hypothetical protein E0L32_011362 [Thyridium curvatum]
MPHPKRRRTGSDTTEEGKSVRNGSVADSPVRLTNVENYPRRRIAVACNLCRFRKTLLTGGSSASQKCDAVRPTCGFCANLGIECQYRDSGNTPPSQPEACSSVPPPASAPAPLGPAPLTNPPDSISNGVRVGRLSDIEQRLAALESNLVHLEACRLGPGGTPAGTAVFDNATSPVSHATSSHLPSVPLVSPRIHFESAPRSSANFPARRESTSSVTPRPGYTVWRQTRSEANTARPSLLLFRAPPYLSAESWDDVSDFYDLEIDSGEYFNAQFIECLATFPDVSKRTTRLLQQSFVENFLGWMPIFEPTLVSSIINQACADDFTATNPNSCLALLILAVGSLAHNHADLKSDRLPGIDYFAHGTRLLERLTFLMGNLTALHCRILQAAYFRLSIRPLLSWNCITQATRDCMHVLMSRMYRHLGQSRQEQWHRAFWACSIMTDELEVTMKMHSIGHRNFQDVVPLPRFENEDTGFYYFLAQISLRKLITTSLDTVGYKAGQLIYAPILTAELRKQAHEWYIHLPTAVRFPVDNTPLFDARKSFLRMQYIILIVALEWASVLRVLETYGTDIEQSEEIAMAKQEAQECFSFCVLYIEVAEEQLLGWKLGTHISIWTIFVFIATLIITHKSPALSFIPETHEETHMHSALDLLRNWAHIPPKMPSVKRAIRIAGCSGGFSDRQRAIGDIAKNCDVDCIIGDWLSECTMTLHGAQKVENEKLRAEGKLSRDTAGLFDPTFMENLQPALPHMQSKGIKLAVNAGASDTEMLARLVEEEVKAQNLSLKVAWVAGDDVTETVKRLHREGTQFVGLMQGQTLSEWGHEVVAAQCYLGGAGIAEALRQGADIVICGRVADAAPTIGASMWWHNWDREQDLDQIAGSLVAGHLIECSAYVTGGYYSGFKRLIENCENLGFPIAEVNPDGTTVITKEPGTDGEVSVGTVESQLLYEIQGPLYYGSDVTAKLEGVVMEQLEKDRVLVRGIKGLPAPSTTKVGITAFGGWQAEFHYYFVGLDIEAKAEWTEKQIRYSIGKDVNQLSCLKFTINGSSPENPRDIEAATVDFRIFVQTKNRKLLDKFTLDVPGLNRWCMENFLQSAPGASLGNDQRQSEGKPFYEYFVSLLPQSEVKHEAKLLWSGDSISIPVQNGTKPDYPRDQKSYNTTDPADLDSFGPTTRGPLGWVVGGRSGDKASDANVGFYVRHDDEYDWLRSLLTVEKIGQLLDRSNKGKKIERFEMPGIRAVHFLLRDHLDRGFNSTSEYDTLGKNVCEFLRAKYVDIPNKFLHRGRF